MKEYILFTHGDIKEGSGMKLHTILLPLAVVLFAGGAFADPAFECGMNNGSQVEIGECVAKMEETVAKTVEAALGIAKDTASSLDEATGRTVAVPALTAAHDAWKTYRDKQCEYAGAMFGGGSGTGIGISACRIELGRARIKELLAQAQ